MSSKYLNLTLLTLFVLIQASQQQPDSMDHDSRHPSILYSVLWNNHDNTVWALEGGVMTDATAFQDFLQRIRDYILQYPQHRRHSRTLLIRQNYTEGRIAVIYTEMDPEDAWLRGIDIGFRNENGITVIRLATFYNMVHGRRQYPRIRYIEGQQTFYHLQTDVFEHYPQNVDFTNPLNPRFNEPEYFQRLRQEGQDITNGLAEILNAQAIIVAEATRFPTIGDYIRIRIANFFNAGLGAWDPVPGALWELIRGWTTFTGIMAAAILPVNMARGCQRQGRFNLQPFDLKDLGDPNFENWLLEEELEFESIYQEEENFEYVFGEEGEPGHFVLQNVPTLTCAGGMSAKLYCLNNDTQSSIDFGPDEGQFGTSDFTVALWIKTLEARALFDVLGNRNTPSHGNFFTIRMRGNSHSTNPGSLSVEVDQDSSGRNYAALDSVGKNLTDGNWHHITVKRSGNTIELDVDFLFNAQIPTAGIANITNNNHLILGAHDGSAGGVACYAGIQIFYEASLEGIADPFKACSNPALTSYTDQPDCMVMLEPQSYCLSNNKNSYATFAPYTAQFGTNDFTIAFWFKTTETLGLVDLLGNRQASSHGNFLNIRLRGSSNSIAPGTVTIEVDQDSRGTNYGLLQTTGNINLADGKWHHLTVMRHYNILKAYVDFKFNNDITIFGIANLSNDNELRLGQSVIGGYSANACYGDFRIFYQSFSDISQLPLSHLPPGSNLY